MTCRDKTVSHFLCAMGMGMRVRKKIPRIKSARSFLEHEGLMRFACLSIRGYVTPLLQHLENYMSKGKNGNRPERKLEAQEKRADLDFSFYINKCQTASKSVK